MDAIDMKEQSIDAADKKQQIMDDTDREAQHLNKRQGTSSLKSRGYFVINCQGKAP